MFLQWFWIYFPIVVTFGITMLTAHALIPSMVNMAIYRKPLRNCGSH